MDLNPKNPSDSTYDDLTAIKGIGQTRQQWLRNTFNVRTFRDLAALSVDAIEAKLKAEKQIPSRSKIEVWLSEAKRFAENPGLVTAAKVNLSTKGDDWKPFASFVVEFQEQDNEGQVEVRTRVHYIESDQTRTWTGVDQYELCQWITQQLGERAQPPIQQAAPEAPVVENPSTPVMKPVIAETLPMPGAQPQSVGELSIPETKPAASEISPAPEAQPQIVEQPLAPTNLPATVQAEQPLFSENLQRMLARAAHAKRSTGHSSIQAAPVPVVAVRRATPTPVVVEQPNGFIISTAPGSQEQAQNEYSARLQQIIAKAQRLSSR